jgi:hypothetical protein
MLTKFPSFITSLDFAALSTITVWQGVATILSADDWSRITGPHGLVFVLLIGLIVMWMKSVRDDASKERRHKESISAQEVHFKALLDLNAANANDLKILSIASTKAQLSATASIIALDNNIIELANHLDHNRTVRTPNKRIYKVVQRKKDETTK